MTGCIVTKKERINQHNSAVVFRYIRRLRTKYLKTVIVQLCFRHAVSSARQLRFHAKAVHIVYSSEKCCSRLISLIAETQPVEKATSLIFTRWQENEFSFRNNAYHFLLRGTRWEVYACISLSPPGYQVGSVCTVLYCSSRYRPGLRLQHRRALSAIDHCRQRRYFCIIPFSSIYSIFGKPPLATTLEVARRGLRVHGWNNPTLSPTL